MDVVVQAIVDTQIRSGEATDVKGYSAVISFLCVSFAYGLGKGLFCRVTSEIIVVFSLSTHYLEGFIFLFIFQLPFLLHNSCTPQWEFCRNTGRRPTCLFPPRNRHCQIQLLLCTQSNNQEPSLLVASWQTKMMLTKRTGKFGKVNRVKILFVLFV